MALVLALVLSTISFSSPVRATCTPVPECELDDHAPIISLSSPANGATSTAPGTFTVSGSASDVDDNLQSVEVFLDGASLGTSGWPSVEVNGLSAGPHTLSVTATDDTGFTARVSRTVTVYSNVNTPPTISLSSPTSYSTWTAPAALTLTATTTDLNGGTVTKVTFKDGNAVVNVDTTSPFTYAYTGVSAGIHPFTAVATDNNGATTTSAPMTVVVNPSGNPAPTVSLSAPAGGASFTYGTPTSVSATASDSNGIASVTFMANGAAVGVDTTSPYSLTFAPSTGGSFVLTAIATDSGGASAIAGTRTVTVSAPPTVSETRRYVYDQNHRLCKTINPESDASVVAYDAASNLLWTAEGQPLLDPAQCNNTGADVPTSARISREYDDLNRVTKVLTPNGDADVYTEYELDGAVKRLTAANPGGTAVVTDYFYNHRRLLTEERQANDTTVYTVDYGYDANAHLKSLAYPDTEIVDYAPDALGRPTQVVGTSATYATAVHYFPNGAMSDFKYGSASGGGPLHTLVQNTRQLPMESRDYKGTTVILDDSYAYDADGNVTSITDAAQTGLASQSRGMSYDGLDRLTTAFGPWGNANYVYDALDNIKRADQGTRQFRYAYDPSTWRLSAINSPSGSQLYSFGYDAQGNTTSKGGQAFVFDIANRMTSAATISGATGLQKYRYDGLGRRVQTTDPNPADPNNLPKTFYVYTQAGQIIYASEARNSINRSYIYLNGSQIAARAKVFGSGTPTVRYQMTDALGSPVASSNTTGAATSIQRTSFTPWGEANPTVDGTGYTGHVTDAGTGLTYMQQRYYDPVIGRFESIDPDGTSFNAFSYANANPFKFRDPDGRKGACLETSGGCEYGSFADGFSRFAPPSDGADSDSDDGDRQEILHDTGRTAHYASVFADGAADAADAADAELTDAKNLAVVIPFEKVVVQLAAAAKLTLAARAPAALVTRNREVGNAFRDELAGLLKLSGRQVRTEVYKWTPFGKRFIDIEVSANGKVLGGVETKVGSSRYTNLQRLKDWWLNAWDGYVVTVARDK